MLRGVGVAIACVASLLSPAIHAADAADSVTGAQQMILVITPDWDSTQASLRRFEQHDGKWQAVSLPHAVVIGKSGAAWGLGHTITLLLLGGTIVVFGLAVPRSVASNWVSASSTA